MSEKRFILNSYENSLVQEIRDTESDFRFSYEKYWIDTSLVDLLNSIQEENEQLRRYVYHCPQICNIILAYLRKCEREDVKAVNDAMNDDKYFDEEVDTLRSWE